MAQDYETVLVMRSRKIGNPANLSARHPHLKPDDIVELNPARQDLNLVPEGNAATTVSPPG